MRDTTFHSFDSQHISTVGVGSLLSSAAISIAQTVSSRTGEKWLEDNLNYFYCLTTCSALNLIVYIWVARRFVYRKTEFDDKKGMKNRLQRN